MNEQRYRAVIAWFNARPAAKQAACLVSRGAVGAVYLLYITLLVILAWQRNPLWFGAAGVPAAAFVVGTALRVRHLSATPVGMEVTARTELYEIDGRRLVFKVEVRDAKGVVGDGEHERFIVKNESFLRKTKGKLE